MLQNQIKELFYSNGVDVFGPVSIEEFSKNRYYKSTLLWYQGLSGWISIGDCKELKHLVGTLSEYKTSVDVPHASAYATPPISKRGIVRSGIWKRSTAILFVSFLILFTFIFWMMNPDQIKKPVQKADTSVQIKDSIIAAGIRIDSNTSITKAINSIKTETEKKTYRMNWEKFISATTNDFKQKEIGGIDDLKIILNNNSPYALNTVKVKVDYVKSNGEKFQSEILQFDNIEAKNRKELFAPSSSRGVNVICSIISVSSTEMNLCLDKTQKKFSAKAGDDSYKCK